MMGDPWGQVFHSGDPDVIIHGQALTHRSQADIMKFKSISAILRESLRGSNFKKNIRLDSSLFMRSPAA